MRAAGEKPDGLRLRAPIAVASPERCRKGTKPSLSAACTAGDRVALGLRPLRAWRGRRRSAGLRNNPRAAITGKPVSRSLVIATPQASLACPKDVRDARRDRRFPAPLHAGAPSGAADLLGLRARRARLPALPRE